MANESSAEYGCYKIRDTDVTSSDCVGTTSQYVSCLKLSSPPVKKVQTTLGDGNVKDGANMDNSEKPNDKVAC